MNLISIVPRTQRIIMCNAIIQVLTKGTELLHAALRYQPDEKRRRRGEIILRVLKEIREYSLVLRTVRSFSS